MVTQVTSLGRSGLSDWLVQRVSGVILLLFFVVVAGYLITNPGVGYAEWKAFFGFTYMKVLSTAAIIALAAHAWIGMWAVSTDYLTERLMGAKGTSLRLLFQLVCGAFIFTYLVWGIQIFWS